MFVGQSQLVMKRKYHQYRLAFVIVALLLIHWNVVAQESECELLFNKFKSDVLFEMEEHGGRVVWDDETKVALYTVMLSCGDKELARYTSDSMPFIRAEIFANLANRTSDINLLRSIQNNHSNDTSSFVNGATSIVMVWKVNEFMKMILNAKAVGDLKTINYQDKLDRMLREIKVDIPGVSHGYVSKESLLKLDSLVCSTKEFEIVSFDLEVTRRMTSNSNCLKRRMKRELGRLKVGDKVYFDRIRVMMPDRTFRNLAPIVLTVR